MSDNAGGGRLVVYTNATPGQDDEFNRWYDEVHIPEILALGPFTAAQRFRIADSPGFEQKHRYLAIYEFEGDAGDAIAKLMAASEGRLTQSDAIQMDQAFMTVSTVLSPRFEAR